MITFSTNLHDVLRFFYAWSHMYSWLDQQIKLIYRCKILFNSQQRWTDSPFSWFIIHLDSQAYCDDSIQLNSSYSGCSEETRFEISNFINIDFNDSSKITSKLYQTGPDSTQCDSYTFPQFIHEIHLQNTANTSPFASSPPTYPS